MAETVTLTGRCACGAVTFEAGVNLRYGACHCQTCRRWAGGVFMAMQSESVRFADKDAVAIWRSSAWAERGSCAKCGSALFYRLVEPRTHYLNVGAFDDQSSFTFVDEVFVDEQPDHYRFAGERRRLTGPEIYAMYGGGQ